MEEDGVEKRKEENDEEGERVVEREREGKARAVDEEAASEQVGLACSLAATESAKTLLLGRPN